MIVYLDICALVTTDDRLVKKAAARRDQLQVDVVKPDQLPLDEESPS